VYVVYLPYLVFWGGGVAIDLINNIC
jgi:hypothetical protein